MKTLKAKIEYCLNKYPDTRNSDTKLTNAVWLEFYNDFLIIAPDGTASIRLLDLYQLPTQDDIKRWRAKFNSKGKYLPTSLEVFKKRKINEELWRSMLGYNPELRTI